MSTTVGDAHPDATDVLDVRVVADDAEARDAGALTAEAYHADRLVDDGDDYTLELRDAERRSHEAMLLVAVVPGGTRGRDAVVGTVTLAPYGTSYAEVAEPGELELRMLAVAPEARRRGVAEALVRRALREAVAVGAERVVLSTVDAMAAAHRLYARLGFVPVPERDWGHVEVHLRVWTWTPPQGPGAELEAAAWPAVRTVDVDGWRLGLSGGLTRRANCVLPLAEPPDVQDALDRVEAVYGDHGQPSIVRICAASRPADLDELLAARDYTAVSPTDVLVRGLDPDGVPPVPVPADGAITVATAPDASWLHAWAIGTPDAQQDLAAAIMLGSPALYLTATAADGLPAGVVRVALVGGWAGVNGLTVDPRLRRRGYGRALLVTGLREAAARGATRAFLQVAAHNDVAAALYDSLGFQPAERYHYRSR